MNTNLTDKEIQTMMNELRVEGRRFVQKEFDLHLDIPIKVNGRLKSTLGRFKYTKTRLTGYVTSVSIELSKIVLYNGYEVALDVLKHELVHYALLELGIPNSDNDREFIQACRERNVTLSGEGDIQAERVVMECDKCGHEWLFNRRKNNHVHRACGGNLVYTGKRLA